MYEVVFQSKKRSGSFENKNCENISILQRSALCLPNICWNRIHFFGQFLTWIQRMYSWMINFLMFKKCIRNFHYLISYNTYHASINKTINRQRKHMISNKFFNSILSQCPWFWARKFSINYRLSRFLSSRITFTVAANNVRKLHFIAVLYLVPMHCPCILFALSARSGVIGNLP